MTGGEENPKTNEEFRLRSLVTMWYSYCILAKDDDTGYYAGARDAVWKVGVELFGKDFQRYSMIIDYGANIQKGLQTVISSNELRRIEVIMGFPPSEQE